MKAITQLGILVTFLSIAMQAEIPFTQIKGLYDPLQKEYKSLSPIHGFNWWQIGIIENMYRFGNPDDATIKLIQELFYLQFDRITFDTTHLKRKPATYFTPQTIGKILKEMHTFTSPS